MGQQWEIQRLAARGDDLDHTTFAGVGRVLSRWEDVETELSFVHSQLNFTPDDAGSYRDYGAGRIFAERVSSLERLAAVFFRRIPNQEGEGEFSRLCNAARGFSARRNDVAHGVVRLVYFDTSVSEPTAPARANSGPHEIIKGFLLLPAHYDPRRFNPQDRPLFAYSSTELNELARRLDGLRNDWVTLRLQLRRLHAISGIREHRKGQRLLVRT